MPTNDLRPNPARQLVGLLGWLLVTFVAAGVGAFASANAGTFYAQLVRPDWAPPAWLFAPVWTVLYLMMALSAWLVWRTHGWRKAATALGLFLVQLAANALWTWLFFAWQTGALAFGEILLLWAMIVATIRLFWRLQVWAAFLLLPYLAWVSLAVALTYATWQSNPALLG